ncbi:MAG: serine hydrolase [Rhodospirillales bacterium]|nr:serine hydrolase [Rhodospirillales bacterium]
MVGSPPPPDKRITHENWDRPPYNRWAFQHVREVLPTISVSKGNGPASTLPEAQQDFDALPVRHERDGRDSTVMDTLLNTYTDGFIVIHNNEVVYECYLNDMMPSTLHLSQSVAKSVTATACGILIGRGEIDRDAFIGDLIPELKNSGYGDAPLRHVMDMRSGVKFGEEYTDPDSDIGKVDVASGWKPMRDGFPTAMQDIPATLTKERDHGGYFQYRSIETDVMAWVMERATGKRLAQIVSEELWQPMGAEHDALYTVDQGGYALAEGGFNATLRDFARVGLLYANKGKVGDRQLVPAEWVRETLQDGDMDAFKNYPNLDHFPRGAYKNQFWVLDTERQLINARGVFGQSIYIDALNNLVAVGLSTWPDFLNLEYFLDEVDVLNAITRELTGH